MTQLTKRAQILFSPKQYNMLRSLSFETHKAVGELVRDAVDKAYSADKIKERMVAAKRLISQNVTVHDWDKMEKIIRQKAGGL